mmetsp:Transcript_134736/g.200509  ORF Transcript_134736/g.200509 Transcript_134736/m.200509 type:complete len:108 (-) Transcript_134736:240-563(-)
MVVSTEFRYVPIIGWRFSNGSEAKAISDQIGKARKTPNATPVYVYLPILGERTEEATNLSRLETAQLLTNVLKLDPHTEPVLKRQSDMIYQLIEGNPSLLERRNGMQ